MLGCTSWIVNDCLPSSRHDQSLVIYIIELYITHCSHHGYLSCAKSPSYFFSGTMLRFRTGLLALYSSVKQPSSALKKTAFHTPHSVNLAHLHLLLVTTTLHHPPVLTRPSGYVSSYCFHFITWMFLMLHSPIFPSLFMQVKFLDDFGITIFSSIYTVNQFIILHTKMK